MEYRERLGVSMPGRFVLEDESNTSTKSSGRFVLEPTLEEARSTAETLLDQTREAFLGKETAPVPTPPVPTPAWQAPGRAVGERMLDVATGISGKSQDIFSTPRQPVSRPTQTLAPVSTPPSSTAVRPGDMYQKATDTLVAEYPQLRDKIESMREKGESINIIDEFVQRTSKFAPVAATREQWPPAEKMIPGFRQPGEIKKSPPKGFTEALGEIYRKPTELLPFIDSADDLGFWVIEYPEAKKRFDAVGGDESKITGEDRRVLLEADRRRGDHPTPETTIGYDIAKGIANLVPYGAAFVMTGGVKPVGEMAFKSVFGKYAPKAIQKLGGITLQVAAKDIPRIAERTLASEKPTKRALPEAIAREWVETFSENYLDVVKALPGGKYAKKIIPKSVYDNAIVRAIQKRNPFITNETIKKIGERAAYHGMAGEWSEERVGDVLRYALALEPNIHIPTGREFITELAVLSAYPIAGKIAESALKPTEPPSTDGDIGEPSPPTAPQAPPAEDFGFTAKPPQKPPISPEIAKPGGEPPATEIVPPAARSEAEKALEAEPGVIPDTSVKSESAVINPQRVPIEVVDPQIIKFDPERFQFKGDVNEKGLQAPLEGPFQKEAAGNLLVYEQNNGDRYIVSGHHRLDLMQRKGITEANAQIIRESDGYTSEDAVRMGAMINIKEGGGTIYDHAKFIRNNPEYKPEGLSATGREGKARLIALGSGDNTYSQFVNREISPEVAYEIAKEAPGDQLLQDAGLQYVTKHPRAIPQEVSNVMRLAKQAPPTESNQMSLFGEDSSYLNTLDKLAKAATEKQRDIERRIRGYGLITSDAKLAEAKDLYGVEVKNATDARKKLQAAKTEKAAWEHWDTTPELMDKVYRLAGVERNALQEAAKLPEIEKVKPEEDMGFTTDMFGEEPPTPEVKAEPSFTPTGARTIPADRTTAITDLTDAKTGETIPEGTPHYRLQDTGETVSEETYRKLTEGAAQGEVFKPGEVGKAEKQPWEMTKKEYKNSGNELSEAYHRNGIITALSENKPVPRAVLADYPDLEAKYFPKKPPLPNYIEKTISKIETIDKKIAPLEQEANGIVASSGVGQAPPIYHQTLDKIIRLKEQQAKIWNEELRGKLFDGKTIWQRAIKSTLPVKQYGDENILSFSGKDIRNMLIPPESALTAEDKQTSMLEGAEGLTGQRDMFEGKSADEQEYQIAKNAFDKMIANSTPEEIQKGIPGFAISAARFAHQYADPKKNQELYNRVYDIYYGYFEKQKPAPPEGTVTSAELPTGITPEQDAFIRNKVASLGSLEAAKKFYAGDAPVEKHGRAVADEVYGGKETPPVYTPSPEMKERADEQYSGWEGKPPKPATRISKLRASAESLQSQIDQKRNPAIGQQNVTARRANIAAGMSQEADAIERTQKILRGMADDIEAGTLPEELANVNNRALVEDVLHKARQNDPRPYIRATDVKELRDKIVGMKGAKEIGHTVDSILAKKRSSEWFATINNIEEAKALEDLIKLAEKKTPVSSQIKESIRDAKRIYASGLDTPDKIRAAGKAMEQYITPESPEVKSKKALAEAKRKLIGVPIPGFFPTPKPVIDKLISLADIEPGQKVLEPSAGMGDIADVLAEKIGQENVDTAEIQTRLKEYLGLKGYDPKGDFLQMTGQYDRIVMNPPFEKFQDIDHVKHAYSLLKPGGKLVSIMGEGVFFRTDKKAEAFRDWLDEVGGTSEKLESGAFTGKEAFRQTGVASRIVVIGKPSSTTEQYSASERGSFSLERISFAGQGAPDVIRIEEGASPVDRIIKQSEEVVKQDRPGASKKFMQKVPGLKQILQYERPSLKMTGEDEKIQVAYVANQEARTDVAIRQLITRVPLFAQLDTAFGKSVVRGKAKSDIKFLGTPEEALSPLTGTLLDILQDTSRYELNADQKATIEAINSHNDTSLKYVNTEYGTDIGHFKPRPESAFLSNVDISEDVMEALGSESRALVSGRGKTRIWDTARDRQVYDKTFEPELNIEKLINGMDNFKASAAGGVTARQVLGGKTRLEAMEETHPKLYNKMMTLRKRLQSLRGSAGRLDEKLKDAVDIFLKSPVEITDINSVQDALDVKLERGKREGMNLENIQVEIDATRAQIKELKPFWEAANLKPYIFVQNGIYRYFPARQASLIKEQMKVSDNAVIRLLQNWKATAFGGDFSPVLGVQTPLGVLADPIGSFMVGKEGISKIITDRNILRPFQLKELIKDISEAPESWIKYFTLNGRVPKGTPEEFAGGFLSSIPGYNAFTEGTYTMVTRQSKYLYDRLVKQLADTGLPELQAEVAAMDAATKIYPLLNTARLGQSQAKASLLQSLPTSYSFIRQPASMIAAGLRGYIKLPTGRLSPREHLAVRLMTTMAASVLATSAVSAFISALLNDDDPIKAAWSAINPSPYNGNFASLILGKHRIPLGGPYRAIFRAIFPAKVSGIPLPVPFAGMFNYIKNRINPLASTQIDLIRNKDYYSRQILKGEFPEKMLRFLEYEIEGVMPLTLGTIAESFRAGNIEPGEMAWQTIGQFVGTNVAKVSKIGPLRHKWEKELNIYDKTPIINRLAYRKRNPDIEAKLFIVGKVRTISSVHAHNNALKIIQENRIDPQEIRGIRANREERVKQREEGVSEGRETWTDVLVDKLVSPLARQFMKTPPPTTLNTIATQGTAPSRGTIPPAKYVPIPKAKYVPRNLNGGYKPIPSAKYIPRRTLEEMTK